VTRIKAYTILTRFCENNGLTLQKSGTPKIKGAPLFVAHLSPAGQGAGEGSITYRKNGIAAELVKITERSFLLL
jgi:hypothetical protein